MRVLLIRPWVNKNITTVKNFMCGEPLGLECVAAILKEQGHQVRVADFMIDARGKLLPYLERFRPHVVGVTSQCTDVVNVLAIAKEVKRFHSRIQVMVGGVQATCFPDSFFQPEVDYVFKSTTRVNVKQLMEEIKDRSPAVEIPGIYSQKLDFINKGTFCYNEYIVPDRTCTSRYRARYQYTGFAPCAVLQTAYGCRNRCTFCIRWKLEGAELREVDIHTIVKQIKELDEPYIMICDNDFLINEKRLTAFCDLLEAQNIRKKYMCYGSVNSILEKPHLWKRLAKNGLMAVIIGYEAFDDKRLEEYHKASTVDDNIKATRMLQKEGIACWGSFILHPDWEKADFSRLLQYIHRIRPELITFSPLVPHPLTPLFEQYKDRLIYPVEQYEKWNFGDVLIYPSRMSLRAYYIQVLLFAVKVNLNPHALSYVRANIPLKNSVKMTLGFRSLLGIYVKNICRRKRI